jgi:hypothetical protein
MKNLGSLLLISVTLVGCATSTVQTRRQEQFSEYSSLSPEQKAAVDRGEIKVGMSMEAVYIALGKPSQIWAGESSTGSMVTWVYHGSYLEQYPYWNYHSYYPGHGYYSSPRLAYDYYPRNYVRAEVIFENNQVKEWRSLPRR